MRSKMWNRASGGIISNKEETVFSFHEKVLLINNVFGKEREKPPQQGISVSIIQSA
jgi:hypothetical protein